MTKRDGIDGTEWIRLQLSPQMQDMIEMQKFFKEQAYRLLFGPIEPAEHTCAEPRKEWYQIRSGFNSEMVCIINDYVYHIDYQAKDWYTPEAKPFALRHEVEILRRCTSFDF